MLNFYFHANAVYTLSQVLMSPFRPGTYMPSSSVFFHPRPIYQLPVVLSWPYDKSPFLS